MLAKKLYNRNSVRNRSNCRIEYGLIFSVIDTYLCIFHRGCICVYLRNSTERSSFRAEVVTVNSGLHVEQLILFLLKRVGLSHRETALLSCGFCIVKLIFLTAC